MMKLSSIWKLLLLFVAANVALLGWNLAHRRGDGLLHVSFLDVGQGDSAVIQTPSGKVIVIDTGGIGNAPGDDMGRHVVAPFLRHEGIGRIDTLILTHPHADHIGGANTLLTAFDTRLLMDNGQTDPSPLVAQYMATAQRSHVPYRAAQRGQNLDCGDGVSLDILAPTSLETRGTANNASVVVRLRYGRTAFLLTGDAEADEEADMVRDGLPLDCDVLKAGHHGSDTSSTPGFLARAHPHWAVLSLGAHNLYGHPHAAVVARLYASGIQALRTDQTGAVLCQSDGAQVQVRAMRPAKP